MEQNFLSKFSCVLRRYLKRFSSYGASKLNVQSARKKAHQSEPERRDPHFFLKTRASHVVIIKKKMLTQCLSLTSTQVLEVRQWH